MFKMLVRHQGLNRERMLTVTHDPNCEYIKKLAREYERKGFVVRFESLTELAHLD